MATGHARIMVSFSGLKVPKFMDHPPQGGTGTYAYRDGELVKVSGRAKAPDFDLGEVPVDYDPIHKTSFYDASLGKRFKDVHERKEYMKANDYFFKNDIHNASMEPRK